MYRILLGVLALAGLATPCPDVYFIRHGEKPKNGETGLSVEGLQRAQCIRDVFGATSEYNIGYILAQKPKSSKWTLLEVMEPKEKMLTDSCSTDGKRARPYETVKPLAEDLGITVDTSCDRDDARCVKEAIENYKGNGNILICWEHRRMTHLAEELGHDDAPSYPHDR